MNLNSANTDWLVPLVDKAVKCSSINPELYKNMMLRGAAGYQRQRRSCRAY